MSVIAISALTTQRLHLRAVTQADQQELLRLWTDREVRRYLWDGRIIDMATVDGIIAASNALFREHEVGLYVLEMLSQPDQLVGFCGLRRLTTPSPDQVRGGIELLYGMFPEFWGSGIVTEAAREVLRHAFADCQIARVIAATDTPNQRSVRVMQRLGMVFETRCEWRGLDTVFYTMTPADAESPDLV